MTTTASRIGLSMLLVVAACTPSRTVPLGGTDGGTTAAFRGLLATPPQLAFTCVIPGCDTTFTVKVSSNVNRRIAVKRVILSEANPDYTITSAQMTPFILGAASDFDVQVRLVPKNAPKAENMRLLVTYTDASADETPDRLEPGELQVPLVRRLVGEPFMAATPQTLSFGVVPVSTTKKLDLNVRNAGFGNIALAVDGFDAGTSPLTVTLPAVSALVPDAGLAVPISFAPQKELYLKGTVEVSSSTPGVDPVFVNVEGTSYGNPHIVLEPEEAAIDFGPVPKGKTSSITLHIANLGGAPLGINQVSVTDPLNNVTAALATGNAQENLDPLQRVDVQLSLDGGTAGVLGATLNIDSNDAVRPHLQIPITGTITSPKLQVSPATADWGTLPMGWVVSKSFEVRSVGYGPLTVKKVSFITGSSTLFTIKNIATLPASLERDQRIAFDVEFRAETAAKFTGSLSIETDDPLNPFIEVPLKAAGGNCADACPIKNGTASCQSGTCDIGSCNTGWYDTNMSAADGCECQDIGTDPSEFCSNGVDKGVLDDNGSSANFTGVLPTAGDIDFLRFFGEDKSQFLGDDYNVQIHLQTSDPNIQMCVYRYDTGSPDNLCALNNEACGPNYSHDGSYGHDDSANYYIKIFRKPNTGPTCTSYTVYMSNG